MADEVIRMVRYGDLRSGDEFRFAADPRVYFVGVTGTYLTVDGRPERHEPPPPDTEVVAVKVGPWASNIV